MTKRRKKRSEMVKRKKVFLENNNIQKEKHSCHQLLKTDTIPFHMRVGTQGIKMPPPHLFFLVYTGDRSMMNQ